MVYERLLILIKTIKQIFGGQIHNPEAQFFFLLWEVGDECRGSARWRIGLKTTPHSVQWPEKKLPEKYLNFEKKYLKNT